MLRIWIHRIHMCLDPDLDPLVRGTDPQPAPDPDPYIIKQKSMNHFLSLKNDVKVPSKSNKQKKTLKNLVFSWQLED
jgi:hypothetical protein